MSNTVTIQGVKFSDSDIVELDDWIPNGEYNPYNVRPWLLHDAGFALCVVFASCLQAALDVACDNGKLERYLVCDEELRTDYDHDDDRLTYLGNAGEPHDIESVEYIELPNPKLSFCNLLSLHSFTK